MKKELDPVLQYTHYPSTCPMGPRLVFHISLQSCNLQSTWQNGKRILWIPCTVHGYLATSRIWLVINQVPTRSIS